VGRAVSESFLFPHKIEQRHDLSKPAQLHPEHRVGDLLGADRGCCSYAHLALSFQQRLPASNSPSLPLRLWHLAARNVLVANATTRNAAHSTRRTNLL